MEKSPLIIILLGKSGSGKGTQVNLLKERYGLDYVGSGELLRERKKVDDFMGKKIAQVIDSGDIILTPVIFSLWMKRFEELKKKEDLKGIILDGSPRKIKEAYLMEEALDWFEWNKNTKVMLVDISDEEAIKRIGKRKICSKCGNIVIVPVGEDVAVCSKCGGEMIVRPEDTVEKTQRRLEWFRTEVGPVVDYYKSNGRLTVINGEQSIEGVFKDIVKEIEG
ncbi:MAG: nucleoside monophosphate kinase [Candidatus Paceibacterota bacterium]